MDDATQNEFLPNDVWKEEYAEYITEKVRPKDIKAVYIPYFLKRFVTSKSKKIRYIDVESTWSKYDPAT